MRIAIYQFMIGQSNCPSCNQATNKMLLNNAIACREKAIEIFGDNLDFFNYVDRHETIQTGSDIRNVPYRTHFNRLLADVEAGKIDAVILTFMGNLSNEAKFIIDFYRFLKEHQVKLVTVREGLGIMDMMEKVLSMES